MCYQVIELYSACRCLYYQHAIDRCWSYGEPRHHVTKRAILVGYACKQHPNGKTVGLDDGVLKAAKLLTRKSPQASVVSQPEKPEKALLPVDAADDEVSSVYDSLFDKETTDGSDYASRTSWDSTPAAPSYVEALTSSLLYDDVLQYLWPQLSLQATSSAQFREDTAQLIRRYSKDLQVLAKKSGIDGGDPHRRLEASRFIEKKRRVIAASICEEFVIPDDKLGGQEEDGVRGEKSPQAETLSTEDGDDDGDDEADDEGSRQDYVQLKQFLLDSEPFFLFRENVARLVAQPQPLAYHTELLDSSRRWFNNNVALRHKPPVKSGFVRLSWTCQCGVTIHDDYLEKVPGAAQGLQSTLKSSIMCSVTAVDLESNAPSAPQPDLGDGRSSRRTGQSSTGKSDERLPWHWQRRKDNIKPGVCRPSPPAAVADQGHNYLLTCVPFGRWVYRIAQPEVCTINSDQDFFSLLRLVYRESRGRLSLAWLRKVKAIHFVQFDLYRTDVADVRSRPSLPPADMQDQYVYDPMPMELVPPIGPNLLCHFFEHPTHAGILPDLYRRVPKKLRSRLSACPVRGSSLGWGIEFAEGMDVPVFFLCGCACFAGCLLVAVCWTVLREDVQGGFGVGGFLLAFGVFCGGIVHSSFG